MTEQKQGTDRLIWFLQERAKELNCLYQVEEHLKNIDAPLEDVCRGLIEVIPPGWQYPDICRARIVLNKEVYAAPDFLETRWVQSAGVRIQDELVGSVSVFYIQKPPDSPHGPFLDEETKLVNTIAERLGRFITYRRMRQVVQDYRTAQRDLAEHTKPEWRVLLDLLKQTDLNLHRRISHKMLNHLCWNGVAEANRLQSEYNLSAADGDGSETAPDDNQPLKRRIPTFTDAWTETVFAIAEREMTPPDVQTLIEKWVQQDKLGYLITPLVSINSDITEVAEAIRRYQRTAPEGVEIPLPIRKNVLVSLIRRFFSEDLEFINIAKHHIDLGDIFDVLQSMIYLPDSHGKLGGKSAGLFLAAQILRNAGDSDDAFTKFKVPATWYISSDVLMNFITFNNFEEVLEQKYKEIERVRLEYPNIVQSFKNSHFPPEIVNALSIVLDALEDRPIIVRSSSLLEDRPGAAFSGKYKSLFLANQGTKEKRLEALLDAVAEVYASTFGPDPIEYRSERGLLDFHEEMGIMIQEVVGRRVGRYFLPAWAGVAFSRNEFRWSSRLQRTDGLVRLVPGLGTRAVDRTGNDFPMLVAPGQPRLRVNVSLDEMIQHSPGWVDVMNLETNMFQTIRVADLVSEFGSEYPQLNQIVSVYDGDRLRPLGGTGLAEKPEDLVVTFEGLITRTDFIRRMNFILRTLEEKLGTPVDIEFACDGEDFYLLQCRALSATDESAPAAIPPDIPENRTIFTATRHVSNGRVPDVTHIVYVDPERYAEIPDRNTLVAIGRAIGALNKLLPKRQFVLIGPGRWGSRGDIKLGVSVTYSDINNTAMLIEVARKSGQYVPEPSFGTHFFQDLVEARIRYLPLYPDDPGVIFNERFLRGSPSVFNDLLPDQEELAPVIRVIDVKEITEGRVLQVLMNADLDRAVGMLAPPRAEATRAEVRRIGSDSGIDGFWRWRLRMVQQMAAQLDPKRFGVKGLYVFGSTKNATAGPGSDIDLLVHFSGTREQSEMLRLWLEGWSLSLAEMNYLQTGYRSEGLLDVHVVTDADIQRKDSFAVKIGAVTDAARPLAMKQSPGEPPREHGKE